MDRTGKIIVGICFALLIGWFVIAPRYLAPKPGAAIGTNAHAGPLAAPSTAAAVAPGDAQPVATEASRTRPTSPEKTQVLENESVRIHFTSHGGGVKRIELKEHLESIACGPHKRFAGTNAASLNNQAPTPAFSLGGGLDGDGDYALTLNGSTVRAEKLAPSGIRIVKEFSLQTNHQFSAKLREIGRAHV